MPIAEISCSEQAQLGSKNKCWEELRVIHTQDQAKEKQFYLEAVEYTNKLETINLFLLQQAGELWGRSGTGVLSWCWREGRGETGG